jgi:uncharacterized protein with beta-barrel porin domain
MWLMTGPRNKPVRLTGTAKKATTKAGTAKTGSKAWPLCRQNVGMSGQSEPDFSGIMTVGSTTSATSAGQFTKGLDYRVRSHWLVGVVADYTYTSGTWNGLDFNANTFVRLPW